MERQPQHDTQNEQERQMGEDVWRQINQDIREAVYDGRAIANVTAKRIAEAIQPGSGPLCDFVMTGTVADDIYSELDVAREVVPELLSWIVALEDYCLSRLHHDKVPGWQEITTEVTDKERIYYGITEALHDGRAIDDATARAIAAQLHGGQSSALYALASSGAVVDGLRAELHAWRENDNADVTVEPWLDALDEYVDGRDDLGSTEDWAQL
jgi:hypothetical protein